MKQLIKEQLQAFDKQEEAYMTDLVAYYHAQWSSTEEEKEVYKIDAEKSRKVLNEWYVTSVKQFIDGLIAREEKRKSNQKQDNGHDCYDHNCEYCENAIKDNVIEETIAHLKELKEELN